MLKPEQENIVTNDEPMHLQMRPAVVRKHETSEDTGDEEMTTSPESRSRTSGSQDIRTRKKKKKLEVKRLLHGESSSSQDEEGMAMIQIPVITPDELPERKSAQAAGFDLRAVETINIPTGSIIAVPTGLRMEIPNGYFGKIESRSGMALQGLVAHAGVIDSDYRGEIKVLLQNTTATLQSIHKGTRVAQLILLPLVQTRMKIATNLTNTQRGKMGFGSTGKT